MKHLVQERGLSIDMVLKTSEADLNSWISAVGFHNKKAKYIKETAKIIKEKHKGVVPSKLEDIIDFPGVGPKMAHLLLQISFGQVEGISVDTHVHRISNRLKWVKPETLLPEKTAEALQDWLPREHWSEINEMLVGFGQTICKPLRPQCYRCKIKHLCPYTPKTKAPSDESAKSTKARAETTKENAEEVKDFETTKVKEEVKTAENEPKGEASSKKRKIEELAGAYSY